MEGTWHGRHVWESVPFIKFCTSLSRKSRHGHLRVFRLLSLLRMMLFIGTRFSNLYTYLSLLRKSRTSRPIMLFLLNCTPDFLRLVCLCVWCLCVWCLCVWCLCVWCLCVWCLCVWCLCVWCHTAPGTAPGDRQEVNSIAFPSTHTQLTTQVWHGQ